jgi:uncharacterized membrane protein
MPRNTISATMAALALVAGVAFAQSEQGTATAPKPKTGATGQGGTMPMMHQGAGAACRGTTGWETASSAAAWVRT